MALEPCNKAKGRISKPVFQKCHRQEVKRILFSQVHHHHHGSVRLKTVPKQTVINNSSGNVKHFQRNQMNDYYHKPMSRKACICMYGQV